VLIIGTGKDTKSLTHIAACDKTYEATVKIGVGTDTMDREGKVIETAPVPNLTIDQLKKRFAGFLGAQKQTPPMYSAKRIKGVRLYKLARKNQTVHRDPVDINIHELQLISYDSPFLRFSVKCSKGTYVRVLGHDIAKSLGSDILDHKSEIEVVYYFGAGCSSKHFASMVERGLSMVFNKSHLYVKEDIVAAAFATFNGEPSITALMGTGSNACHFDGDRSSKLTGSN